MVTHPSHSSPYSQEICLQPFRRRFIPRRWNLSYLILISLDNLSSVTQNIGLILGSDCEASLLFWLSCFASVAAFVCSRVCISKNLLSLMPRTYGFCYVVNFGEGIWGNNIRRSLSRLQRHWIEHRRPDDSGNFGRAWDRVAFGHIWSTKRTDTFCERNCDIHCMKE